MAKIALVRKPGPSYSKCVSDHPQKHNLNLIKALEQHQLYCSTLEDLGLDLIYVPDKSNHPDSCFVEDTVVIHNNNAMICHMGEKTRRGEEIEIEEVLRQYFNIFHVDPPGTVEGGDVIHFKNKLISGITQRTNKEGAMQLEAKLGISVENISDNNIVHLKSYMTALSDSLIVVTKTYADQSVLKYYEKIVVPQNEEYAANTLAINGTVIIPDGNPIVKKELEKLNFDVVSLQMSEFQKCNGALTCLSVIF